MEKLVSVTYIVFKVGRELLGVPIDAIQRVMEYVTPTHIPDTPLYLKGIVNSGGNLVPVVSAHIKFGVIEPECFSRDACIVVMQVNDKNETFSIGMAVDKAFDVVEVDADTIETVPEVAGGKPPGYIRGIFNYNDEIVYAINVGTVFSREEVVDLKKIKKQ